MCLSRPLLQRSSCVSEVAASGRSSGGARSQGPGIILFAFTAAILLAIKHAPVTAVLSIGTAAPLITLALQATGGHAPRLAAAPALSLALTVVAAAGIAFWGVAAPGRRPAV